MSSAESPVPEPSLYLTPLVIALSILFSVVLVLAGLHFLLKSLRSRVHPAIPQSAPAASRGVDCKVLESIPVQTYSKDFKFLRPEFQHECSVCLSGLEGGEMVRVLPGCRHVFHVECIDLWFASHASCPFCRSEITAVESLVLNVGEVNEESDGGLNGDGEHQRSNSLVWRCDSSLMSFREKLRLKRCLSLDSCNV